MSENLDELQAKVARLAGRINRHKSSSSASISTSRPYQGTGKGIVRPPRLHFISAKQVTTTVQDQQGYRVQKWPTHSHAPTNSYASSRGRGWVSKPPPPPSSRYTPHRHRTLVVNGQTTQGTVPAIAASTPNHSIPSDTLSQGMGSANGTSLPPPNTGWVTKRDRHMQLINNAVYDKKTLERSKAMEQTRRRKQQERERRELAKVNSHLAAVARSQSTSITSPTWPASQSNNFYVTIHEIKFLVADGGSKLLKAQDDENRAKAPPKRVIFAGVVFIRSKHGNLYRAGLVKAKRGMDIKKGIEACPQFSTTGTCPKGPMCRHVHDPVKVAICREFLLTGKCPADLDCDLSHDPTPERVPACVHFQRGNCTNPECRYAHVKTNPGAPVCRPFATLGYCAKGLACTERHIHECPDYSNKGFCRNKKCRLPHVDRAGQLRKKAAPTNLEGENESLWNLEADASSDVSSDEDLDGIDSDDLDSSDLENEDPPTLEPAHDKELSQQNDFVSF